MALDKSKVLTLVKNAWGEGLYDGDGNLIDYAKDKNGGIQPEDILEFLGYKVKRKEAHGAEWEFNGQGFPGLLKDALDMKYEGEVYED